MIRTSPRKVKWPWLPNDMNTPLLQKSSWVKFVARLDSNPGQWFTFRVRDALMGPVGHFVSVMRDIGPGRTYLWNESNILGPHTTQAKYPNWIGFYNYLKRIGRVVQITDERYDAAVKAASDACPMAEAGICGEYQQHFFLLNNMIPIDYNGL